MGFDWDTSAKPITVMNPHLPLAGVRCPDPPIVPFQSVALDDPACNSEGCTATYTCTEGLTLMDGRTTYQRTCTAATSTFRAEWVGDTQTCSKDIILCILSIMHDN